MKRRPMQVLVPICEIDVDSRLRLFRAKRLFRQTRGKATNLRRRIQKCEEEDKADAAEEEQIRVRRRERQQEMIKLWAERDELGKTMRGLRASFGEALDGDMETWPGLASRAATKKTSRQAEERASDQR